MDNLRIYRIREGFIEYLHKVDNRVQFNKGERRPYVGIVLEIEGHDYFVPMESPRPNHINIKSGIHIMRIDNGKYGLLGFNNMIPAKKHHLIEFDIDSEQDSKYRDLLRNQLKYCNQHKKDVYEHARKTYKAVTEKASPFFKRICCDFKLLEREYVKYYFKALK